MKAQPLGDRPTTTTERDRVRAFCERNGLTVMFGPYSMEIAWGKQTLARYWPASGRVDVWPAEQRFPGTQGTYQVADFSGVEAIIRGRMKWKHSPDSTNPSRSE